MGSTSLDSRVLSSAELRVSGESMEKGPSLLSHETLPSFLNEGRSLVVDVQRGIVGGEDRPFVVAKDRDREL